MLNGTKENQPPKTGHKIGFAPQAIIAISYRLEGKHLGKASFYDHFTVASHTGYPTAVIHANKPEISIDKLKSFITTQTVNIPQAPMDDALTRPVPVKFEAYADGGLLFIPGMTRDSYEKRPETHKIRISFEKSVLKEALLRGRPIMAVCAGSWTLWESLGGTITEATDHNYGGGMPRISDTGKMTHNKHVHDVEVKNGTLVHTMLGLDNTENERTLPVNSIHWMAPSALSVPHNYEISATAKQSNDVSIQTRQQTEMTPQENTVESFSSIHGAPIAGILWHPEAFDWSSRTSADKANTKMLLFMAKAGSAYQAKQKMLHQFKETAHAVLISDDLTDLDSVFAKMKI